MSGTPPSQATAKTAVLVIDPNTDQLAVLCELLTQLGLRPIAARSVSEACGRLSEAPAGVVLADGDALSPAEMSTLLIAAGRTDSPIVVAGTNRPLPDGNPRFAFVRKPYQYRELVHKIWSALGVVETEARAAA